MQIFPFQFFCDIVEKMHLCFMPFWVVFAFCVITVVPIMIQTCSAPQSDRLNLHFVKDFHLNGTKWPKMVVKWPFMSCIFPVFFLTILKIKGKEKNCDLSHSF